MATNSLPLEQIAGSLSRMLRLAERLGRVGALEALVAGLREGGDVETLIMAMLAYERMMNDAEAERRAR